MESPDRKSTKRLTKCVKEVACEEQKPLQAKSSIKEAVEKRLHFDGLKVAAGDREVVVRKAYNCFEL
jgi:hypothetical protein